MFHGIKNVLSAIAFIGASLLLLLAIRSYFNLDSLYFEWGARGYFICSAKGELGAIETSRPFSIATYNFGRYAMIDSEPVAILENALSNDATHQWGVVRFGSGNLEGTSKFTGTLSWLAVPLAIPIVLLFIPAFIRIRSATRRRSRILHHQCLVCGHNLAGDADRCPQCGAALISSPAAAHKSVLP
jgi:hypothetical protein